jgi:ParB family chromosome partitioning protein
LKEKKIDMGHARGLLQAKNSVDQLKIYEEILKNGLSVRKVEEMARNMNLGNEVTQSEPKKTKKEEVPEEYGVMQERLSSLFGTNVDLSVNAKGKGKISIPFKNDDELAKIMEVLDSMGSNSEIN